MEAVGVFTKMIQDSAQDWLNAAEDIETLLPRLPEYDRHVWAVRAKAYRDRAYEFERVLSSVRGNRSLQR